MTPSRPYLIRALYDWIVDNGMTPYVVIDATRDAIVPKEHVEDGRIVLNIAMDAVTALSLGNEAVEFKARFSGKVRRIYAPTNTVLAVYASENGRGMVFNEEDLGDHTGGDGPGAPDSHTPPTPKRGKPNLKVVK